MPKNYEGLDLDRVEGIISYAIPSETDGSRSGGGPARALALTAGDPVRRLLTPSLCMRISCNCGTAGCAGLPPRFATTGGMRARPLAGDARGRRRGPRGGNTIKGWAAALDRWRGWPPSHQDKTCSYTASTKEEDRDSAEARTGASEEGGARDGDSAEARTGASEEGEQTKYAFCREEKTSEDTGSGQDRERQRRGNECAGRT
ncbi:hypothetical protein F5Y08DRAFT_346587 [Xylaria arbuscula]|nr:hypothetical protein F5Y08DRAFT_346587 [Xylaria arbuscula]